MPRYVAFLRGINLGNRRVKSDALRTCVADLGFDDVAVFRASGNVILTGTGGAAAVTRTLEAGLERALGYDVAVFLRSCPQVRAIAAHRPFDAKALDASAGKVQVLLLAKKPAVAAQQGVLALATDADRLALHGQELYWLPSGGISQSALDLKAIGALLGTGTMRTQGTIELIAAKHCAVG